MEARPDVEKRERQAVRLAFAAAFIVIAALLGLVFGVVMNYVSPSGP